MRLFSQDEIVQILNINNTALNDLVKTGKIPFNRIISPDGDIIRFCPAAITRWVKNNPDLSMDSNKYIARYKQRLEAGNPEFFKKIKKFGSKYKDPHAPKKYYLEKIPNKKLGYVYYVRYLDNGKLICSRWCTHTNDEDTARRFAADNRDRLVTQYYKKAGEKKPYVELYAVLKKYYEKDSPYLQVDASRGRDISEDYRIICHNFITKQFIPYLRKNKIKRFDQIDTPFLARFQNYLLADKKARKKTIHGIKSQTINTYISHINFIFKHLLTIGQVQANPCCDLTLPVVNIRETGCYETNSLKGVFNKKWKNELHYLLCLMICSTGMRNSEIERVRTRDLFLENKINFINISESKSKNGIRMVPLHDFVRRKLLAYARKNKKKPDDFIFTLPGRKKLGPDTYRSAYMELGKHAKYGAERMSKENITYYSGRHFWKTLMNEHNLGDVEEYFMGHKVSADVAKRYNHRDKQGKEKIAQKARQVFKILDARLFAAKAK